MFVRQIRLVLKMAQIGLLFHLPPIQKSTRPVRDKLKRQNLAQILILYQTLYVAEMHHFVPLFNF